MDVFDYIEKELDRIEVGYTSYDGTRLTMSIDDVRELIENLRMKLAQNLPNACTDPIEREDVINILHNAMQGRSESEENLIGEIVNKVDLLPSARPDHIAGDSKMAERTAETAQNIPNDDLISKKMAIDAINTWDKFGVDERGRLVRWHEGLELYVHLRDVLTAIVNLPSARPERKKGKWEIINLGAVGVFDSCSECKRIVKHKAPFYDFCPNCGADMRGDQDE